MKYSNELKSVLESIESLKHNETISVEEIIKKLDMDEELAFRTIDYAYKLYLISIEGRYPGEIVKLEKHHRILPLGVNGFIFLDLLNNPKVIEELLINNPSIKECSVYTIYDFILRQKFSAYHN